MRVRLSAGISVSRLRKRLSFLRHSEFWHKAVAYALPRNRDRCPRCRSKDFLRSRRKNVIEFALSSLILPYRCSHCYFRFFRAVEPAGGHDPKHYRPHYPTLQQAR
jgi:hypothetical protein